MINRMNKILKKKYEDFVYEYEVGVFISTLCVGLLYNQGTLHHLLILLQIDKGLFTKIC